MGAEIQVGAGRLRPLLVAVVPRPPPARPCRGRAAAGVRSRVPGAGGARRRRRPAAAGGVCRPGPAGRGRAGGLRAAGRGAGRAPRPGPLAAPRRPPRDAGRLGVVGRPRRGRRDPAGDGRGGHQLLRAQAVDRAGRAVPPDRRGVRAGVVAQRPDQPARGRGVAGPALGAGLGDPQPADPQRHPARVPRDAGQRPPTTCCAASTCEGLRGSTAEVLVWMAALDGTVLLDPTDVEVAEAWGVGHRPRRRQPGLRRPGRRRRAVRPGRRGLRLVGGPAHARGRAGVDRRPGRVAAR